MNNTEAVGGKREDPATTIGITQDPLKILQSSIYTALETYSNVHRGSGHYSQITSCLFERARKIVLEYSGLDPGTNVVIFCSPGRVDALVKKLGQGSYLVLSSQDIGLALGVRALVVARKALPKGPPFQAGGGTTRLVSKDWIIWAGAPGKFEAGTPAIINVIAFARALQMIRRYGKDVFKSYADTKMTPDGILYHDDLDGYSGQQLLEKLRESQIGRNVPVPTAEGNRNYINLDYGASTPAFIPGWNAFYKALCQSGPGRQDIINEVRSVCAGLLNAPLVSYDVIFTSNATESINLVAEILSRGSSQEIENVVLNTLLEHNSNDLPWRTFPGLSLLRLGVDPEGFVDLKELESLLREYNQEKRSGRKRIRLVAVSGASNVLGIYNDLKEISTIVHRYGAYLLVDAAQMVAHRRVETEQWGIDYLVFSAHKVYAPFGTGVLLARKGISGLTPAETKKISLSGEENIGGIAALGKMLVVLQRIGLELVMKEEQALTRRALQGLSKIQGLTVHGIRDPDSPSFTHKGGVIAFSLKGIMPDKVAKKLALQRGIGVRYGCHCAHLLVKYILNVPPFLEKFQKLLATFFPGIVFPGVTRMSLGIGNTEEDINIFLRTLGNIARQSSQMAGSGSDLGSKEVTEKEVKQQIDNYIKKVAEKVYNNFQ